VSTIYEKLSAPFPTEMERTLNKGGARLTYIPQAEIVNRLNKVFGVDNWTSETVDTYRDHHDPDWVIARVRLTATTYTDTADGVAVKTFSRDGIGGQKIKRTKSGDIVDLGDEFKGAASDALKKAATLLGIALYLARDVEAMDAEEEEQKPEPKPDPAWDAFASAASMLDAEGKAALASFWKDYGKGRPKPTKDSYNPEDLEALHAETVRLTLGGSFES